MIFDGIEKQVVRTTTEPCRPDEVIVYWHISGTAVRECYARVGAAIAHKAKGMICEAEILSTGEIALYVHWPDEQNYGCELAVNEPGNPEPTQKLSKMISAKYAEKKALEEGVSI